MTRDGQPTVVLDAPYEAVRESAFGMKTFQSSPQDVAKAFGPALAAQPARATKFTLYFIEGKDTLTKSKQLVETSLAEIAAARCPTCSSSATPTWSAATPQRHASRSSAPI